MHQTPLRLCLRTRHLNEASGGRFGRIRRRSEVEFRCGAPHFNMALEVLGHGHCAVSLCVHGVTKCVTRPGPVIRCGKQLHWTYCCVCHVHQHHSSLPPSAFLRKSYFPLSYDQKCFGSCGIFQTDFSDLGWSSTLHMSLKV